MKRKNPNIRGSICFLLFFLGILVETHADVKVATIFGDHMVLQREMAVPLWGWADRGEKVTVTLAGQTVSARPDKSAKWMGRLAPMAAGGPYEMVIRGKNTILLKDILIGDVWICGGQSNMEMPMKGFSGEPIVHSDREIRDADYTGMRMITVNRNMSTVPADHIESDGWIQAVGRNIEDFSAVGYFFGKEIHTKQDIPVGLINVNWGGTNCETWTGREALKEGTDYSGIVGEMEASGKTIEDYRKESSPSSRFGPNSKPTLLFNGMLSPLIPYGIKGVIWYQGESNASRAHQYRTLFPLMIRDWRGHWNQGDFPFLFVQLAAHHPVDAEPVESSWAELREAQQMALTLPNTGMAVTTDIGHAENIHPANKEEVGKRLSLAAFKIAYNQDIVCSGPIYQSYRISGENVIIEFNHTGQGLMVKDKYGYLKGFAIAGKDRKFYWARAYLDGNTVVIYHPLVPEPVAVRYAWSDNPDDANLYNQEGLPASPFRTDDWPGITLGKK